MTGAGYFDEDAFDERSTDSAVRAMARRQFGVSLAVALALLSAAGLMILREHRETPAESAALHSFMHADARGVALAPAAGG
ncbi:MAG: hypothetical protein ACLQE9_03065 [Roseiarcus sp.]